MKKKVLISHQEENCHYKRLLNELRDEDPVHFLRIDPAMFQELLAKVGPRIEKTDTFCLSCMVSEWPATP